MGTAHATATAPRGAGERRRTVAVDRYRTLDIDAFDRVTALAARIFDAPITTADGHRLGTVNVAETRPRDAAVRKLLGDLGKGVTDDTALPALSVPTRTTTVPVQENR